MYYPPYYSSIYPYGYPYWYPPYGYRDRRPSNSLTNSQLAVINQSFYNAGVAQGVYQTANNYNSLMFNSPMW
jgi:hypothetical protein